VQESLKIKDFSIFMTQTPVENILRMFGDKYNKEIKVLLVNFQLARR
jgi:hypothetical protein